MNHLIDSTRGGRGKGRASRSAGRPRRMVEALEGRCLLALTINPTFDTTITSLPNATAIEATINQTIAAYEAIITDNVTVNITFKSMSTGLGMSSGGTDYFENYGPESDPTSYLAHLLSHATSANDNLAINSLPNQTNDPVNNQAQISVRAPVARALGFAAPTTSDGTISINTGICNINRTSPQNPSDYDFQAVVSHELDEILAGGSALDGQINGNATPTGMIEPLDLYRYSAAGTRSFTTSAAVTSYFSIDGGTTNLVGFNQYAPDVNHENDFGDWFSNNGAGATTPRVQDSNATRGAQPNLNVELTRLDILGFTLASLTGPQVTVSSQAATEGISHSFSLGNFTDATLAPYGVTVNWGDGSPNTTFDVNSAGSLGSQSHTYTEEGKFNASVTVTDFASGTQTQTFQVNVGDADLTAGAPVSLTSDTGVALPNSTVVGTFTDANTFATTADYTGTIDWGDGSPLSTAVFVATATPGVFDVEGGHIYATHGVYTTLITVHDDGGSQVVITGSATVTDLPVTGSTQNFTAVEGQNTGPFVLATFTDPNTLATVADVNATLAVGGWGDGTPAVAGVGLTIVQTGVDPSNGDPVFDVVGSHTYAEETPAGLPDTLSVIITTLGGATTTLTSPPGGGVTVLDAALAGSTGNAITGVEGSSTGTVLLGTFVDANQAATVADFTSGGGSVVVNWGDGLAPQTLAASNLTAIGTPNGVGWTINAAHTYTEEGTYSYTVTVTDDGGASTIVSGSAIIADAALTAGAATALTASTGVALPSSTIVATFTDANTFATTADFTGTIDWGDGSPLRTAVFVATATPGLFDVEGGHSYARFGAYTTLVTVSDDGGSRVVVTGSATVTDPAITGTGHNFTSVEGQDSGSVLLATIDNPNLLATAPDITALLTTWGDGTPATPVALTVVQASSTPTDTVFDIFGHHNYHDEGTFTFSLTVTTLDPANPAITLTGAATVTDAPLTGSSGTELTGVEGVSTGTVLIGTFTDSNPFAPTSDFTVSINWGDKTTSAGSVSQPGGIGTVFLVNGAHTYAEEGTYAVTATITDVGGQSTVTAASAIIADAPLTPSATQPIVNTTQSPIYPIPEFATPVFTGRVAAFNDANPMAPLTDYRVTIDWGDGTPQSAGTVSQPGPIGTTLFVTGSHTYADAGVNGGTGTYPITVYITDVGGSDLTVSNTAHVADIPITLTGILNPASDSGLSTGTPDVTNVTQPDFFGSSEDFSHVSLFATPLGGGTALPIGTVQAGSDGSWNIVSTVALPDGHYMITATAIDQFHETTTVTPTVITSNLLIDTAGPIITGAFFNRLNGEVDFTIEDPGAAPSGVELSTLLNSANYLLTKVHANKAFPGKWIVTDVTTTAGPVAGSYDVAVVFNSGRQIKGGFYLFTIRDSTNGDSSVQDLAENHLDGVFYGSFPSGNGVNGSDFVAELDGFHNKIFAPQTIIGTANNANGGAGGPPVGAVHSGIHTPVVPVGGGSVFGSDRKHLKGTRIKTDRKEAKQVIKTDRKEAKQVIKTDRKEAKQVIKTDRKEAKQVIKTDRKEAKQVIKTNRKEAEHVIELKHRVHVRAASKHVGHVTAQAITHHDLALMALDETTTKTKRKK
jgi:Bacterial Ig-like domain